MVYLVLQLGTKWNSKNDGWNFRNYQWSVLARGSLEWIVDGGQMVKSNDHFESVHPSMKSSW